MAKKAVATFKADKGSKRTFVKCIKMEKSDRSGAYIFKEDFVGLEQEKDFFKK